MDRRSNGGEKSYTGICNIQIQSNVNGELSLPGAVVISSCDCKLISPTLQINAVSVGTLLLFN